MTIIDRRRSSMAAGGPGAFATARKHVWSERNHRQSLAVDARFQVIFAMIETSHAGPLLFQPQCPQRGRIEPGHS